MLISSRQFGSPRRVLRFDKFMGTVATRTDYSKMRFRHADIKTGKSIQFFTSLLNRIFDDGMLKRDMLDIYLNELVFMLPSVSNMFDSTQSGIKIPKNLIIAGDTEEVFIPTSGLIGTEVTVLDSWDSWKKVQPVKLVACDSNELITKWVDTVRYSEDPPTYAVFAIDTAALLVKYLVYLRHFDMPLDNPDICKFIREHVLYQIFDDFADVWTHRLLLDASKDGIPEDLVTNGVLSNSMYKVAAAEVQELYYDFVRGHFRLGAFMNTQFYRGRSISDMVYLYENTYATIGSNRYVGYQLLKLSSISNLVVNGLIQSRDRGLESAAIRKLVEDSRMLHRSNWKSHVREDHIITTVSELYSNIESMGIELT